MLVFSYDSQIDSPPPPQDNIDSEWKDHMLEVNIVQGKEKCGPKLSSVQIF